MLEMTSREMLENEVVRLWWERLPPDTRTELQALWDVRAERVGHSLTDAGWAEIPLELREDDNRDDIDDWRLARRQWVEYVANQEATDFYVVPPRHICRAHPAARAVLARGVLEPGFECPMGRSDRCPMKRLLRRSSERPLLLRNPR